MKMLLLISLLLSLPVSFSFGNESISGSSRFRIDLPKKETHTVTSARFVDDSEQALTASCPQNTELISAGCSGDSREFGSKFILKNTSFHSVFTKTSISKDASTPSATCNAIVVRPDESVKLFVTLKCKDIDAVSAAAN